MKTFEDLVVQARADFEAGGLSLGLASVVLALQALAAERAAKRPHGPVSFAEFCAGIETAQPRREPTPYERATAAPRSYSHWGLH